MIKNMTGVLQNFCDGVYDDVTKWIRIDAVRLCRLLLNIYFAAGYRSRDSWRALWEQCAKAVGRYHENAGWTSEMTLAYWRPVTPTSTPDEILRDDQGLTRECLTIIAFHPELYTPTDPHVKAPIPAELVAALWLFTTSEVKQQFSHFQQILLLPTNDSSDIGEEDEASEGEDDEDEESEDEEDGEVEDEGGEGEGKGEGQDAESEDNMDGEGEGGEKNVDAESRDGERKITEADKNERAALQESVDADIDASKQETSDGIHSGTDILFTSR